MPNYIVAERKETGSVWTVLRTEPVGAADAESAVRSVIGTLRDARHYRVIDFATGEVSNFVSSPPVVPQVDLVAE